MSYVITPSEKARSKTNPQPIGLQNKGEINPLRLLLKNIFGFSIPYLQFLVFFGLLFSTLILETSLWLLMGLGLLYIVCDVFAKRRDLRSFFTGFEWFYIAIIGFLFFANDMDLFKFLHGLIYYRWIIALSTLPYLFYLFPGINRYLLLFIYGGLTISVFGLFQHFTGWHPFLENFPVYYSFLSYDAYAIAGSFDSPLTFGLVFSSINSFIWTRFLSDLKNDGEKNYLYLLMALILSITCFFTYDLRIWILSILSLIIPCFFISKKYFLISSLSVVTIFYLLFWSLEPFRDIFLHVQNQFEILKAQMHTTHALWFESINKNLWFGDQTFPINLFAEFNLIKSASWNIMENSYLLLLKQVGVIGFVIFLGFFLQCLLLNLRLIKEIPPTHKWHKVLALGTLCIQVNMHLAGLFFPIFTHSHILFLFIVLISVLIYFDDAYGIGIVPDDSCL